MRVLTDFHHYSLLRSINLLFGDRLGMDVYRPIGMDWYHEKAWAVYDHPDTAKQYLDIGSIPIDGTPPLNEEIGNGGGEYKILDPGHDGMNRACTMDFFKYHKFDYLIASLPQHIPIFERLIKEYQPDAKLIIQVGNNWDIQKLQGKNVLASIKEVPTAGVNVKYYHQEFELDLFRHEPLYNFRNVFSFINNLDAMPFSAEPFRILENVLQTKGFNFKSFGGQCRDGAMQGHPALADKMREAAFIYHVKETEGFGHVIYNAYAVGRPVIVSKSKFQDVLCGELLKEDTFIDIDGGALSVAQQISALAENPIRMQAMGEMAAAHFRQVVDYEREGREIGTWLNEL